MDKVPGKYLGRIMAVYDLSTKGDICSVSEIQNQKGYVRRLWRNPWSKDRDYSQLQRRLRLRIRGTRGVMELEKAKKNISILFAPSIHQ